MGPKKKFPCPNPLFVQWLEEWKQEAEDKGLNSKWTYQKAMNSLRKYPLPLNSGKEAKIIENIGDGIAKKLDKRLEEFISGGGDLSELHARIEEPAPKRRKRKKDPENEFVMPKSPNMKSPTRSYIPKYRSGPYAILIALYNESKKSTYVGYLTKVELQLLAQPLCETSMTIPDPGSHYTAWSSMGNLLKKGLVLKWSSPAKFNITSTGNELAEKLLNGLHCGINTSSSMCGEGINKSTPDELLGNLKDIVNELNESNDTQRKDYSSTNGETRNNFMQPGSYFAKLQNELNHKNTNKPQVEERESLKYWYVTESGRCTALKSNALVTINGDLNGVGFLIKVKKQDLEKSGILFKYDHTRSPKDGYHFAYLADKGAKEIASVPEELEVSNQQQRSSYSSSSSKPTNKIKTNQSKQQPYTSTKTTKDVNIQISKPSSTKTTKELNHPNINQKPVHSQIPDFTNHTRKENTTQLSTKPPHNPLFTLQSGMFDVILLVDIIETSGGGRRKKEMAENLQKTGVKMEVRKLQLGDFLWIAKEKFGSQREVVLDFVLERKRMDDLASSIVDGRFKEQKFRLKSCGLMKLIYLVEQYGSVEHFVVPESTLKQAIMNTQIVDNLFIKETNSIQDSVEYLRLMTLQLIKLYKNKTIHAHYMDEVKTMKSQSSFDDIISRKDQYLITFDEFSSQTDKNKVLTVREMFAKQLMQIKGVSADRAVAIVDHFPTPTCYVEALEGLSSDHEKINLLTNITFGKTKRKIGLPISRQVFLHYTKR